MVVLTAEQVHQGGQRGQQCGGDRTQLPDMTEGERTQERPQRRRGLHPGQHLMYRTFP
jgi:hypothetical protein